MDTVRDNRRLHQKKKKIRLAKISYENKYFMKICLAHLPSRRVDIDSLSQ